MVRMKMKKKIDIEIIDKKQIPQSEPERQYYFMDIAKNYVEQLSAKKRQSADLSGHDVRLPDERARF